MAETESSTPAISNPDKELSLVQRIAYWIEEKGVLDRLLLRKRAVDVFEGARWTDFISVGSGIIYLKHSYNKYRSTWQ